MSEQIDIAVDLGVVPAPQIIEGGLHQGSKAIYPEVFSDLGPPFPAGPDWRRYYTGGEDGR